MFDIFSQTLLTEAAVQDLLAAFNKASGNNFKAEKMDLPLHNSKLVPCLAISSERYDGYAILQKVPVGSPIHEAHSHYFGFECPYVVMQSLRGKGSTKINLVFGSGYHDSTHPGLRVCMHDFAWFIFEQMNDK